MFNDLQFAHPELAIDFVGSSTQNPNSPTLPDSNHEGHASYRIDEIAANIGTWIGPTGANPDYILLHIGTNDFGQDYQVNQAINRLDSLIGQIAGLRPDAKVIVTTLLDRTRPADVDRQQQIVTLFNPFVEGIVNQHAALGQEVYFLNMNAALNPLTDLADGLHPNLAGYNKMADAWFSALNPMLSVPEPTSAALCSVAFLLLPRFRRRLMLRASGVVKSDQ